MKGDSIYLEGVARPAGLKGCPFCGRAPKYLARASTHTEHGEHHALVCHCGGYAMTAHQGADTQAGVVEQWNGRTAPAGWKLVPDYQVGMHVRFNDDEYRICALGDKPGTFDLEPVPYDIKNSRWLSVHPGAMEPLTPAPGVA